MPVVECNTKGEIKQAQSERRAAPETKKGDRIAQKETSMIAEDL